MNPEQQQQQQQKQQEEQQKRLQQQQQRQQQQQQRQQQQQQQQCEHRPSISILAGGKRRRWSVVIAISVLLVYIILGSAAFFILEDDAHQDRVRKWHFQLSHDRRQFANLIARRMFNETKNMVVFIDRDQTLNAQAVLVRALKEYETRLDIKLPNRMNWNLANSINYVLALLTTVGSDNRIPQTTSGQFFSLFYSLIGVPFLFGVISIIIYRFAVPALQDVNANIKQRVLKFQIILCLYLFWILLAAIYLSYFVDINIRVSIYIAVFSILTIQTPYAGTHLDTTSTLVVLMMVLIALILKVILLFLLVSLYNGRCDGGSRSSKVNDSHTAQLRFSTTITKRETKLAK